MLRQLNSLLLLMTASGSPFSTAALYLAAGSWQTVAKEFDRMKRSLLCALLSLAMICGATALYAQQDAQQNTGSQSGQRGHQMMSPDQRLEHMTKTLDLNNEQQQNIKIILEKQQTDAQALRQDTSLSPAQRRAKMQELRQSTDQQINDILSPEQQQKWQQVQEQHTEPTGQGASAGQGMKPR